MLARKQPGRPPLVTGPAVPLLGALGVETPAGMLMEEVEAITEPCKLLLIDFKLII